MPTTGPIDDRKLTNWYDFMAPFYGLWRDNYDNPQIDHVAATLRDEVRPGSILDVGCGTGLFTIGLARANGDWRVEGLDASEGMVAVARRKAAKLELANVSFRQGDATRLPYEDASFDAAVAVGLFVNLNAARPALAEIHRVLRPGGRLSIVEFDRQAMTLATKTFFRVMILGYKLFSTFVPRFRFADRWNLETTTIDLPGLEADLAATSFARHALVRNGGQMVLHYVAQEPAAS